jgi:hypothetical protein
VRRIRRGCRMREGVRLDVCGLTTVPGRAVGGGHAGRAIRPWRPRWIPGESCDMHLQRLSRVPIRAWRRACGPWHGRWPTPGTRTSCHGRPLTSRETAWMGRTRRPRTGHALADFADGMASPTHAGQCPDITISGGGRPAGHSPHPPRWDDRRQRRPWQNNNLQQVLDLLPGWIYLGPARFLRRIPQVRRTQLAEASGDAGGRGGDPRDVGVAGRAALHECPAPGRKNFPPSIRRGGRWPRPWMEASSSRPSGIHNYVGAMFHACQ